MKYIILGADENLPFFALFKIRELIFQIPEFTGRNANMFLKKAGAVKFIIKMQIIGNAPHGQFCGLEEKFEPVQQKHIEIRFHTLAGCFFIMIVQLLRCHANVLADFIHRQIRVYMT